MEGNHHETRAAAGLGGAQERLAGAGLISGGLLHEAVRNSDKCTSNHLHIKLSIEERGTALSSVS